MVVAETGMTGMIATAAAPPRMAGAGGEARHHTGEGVLALIGGEAPVPTAAEASALTERLPDIQIERFTFSAVQGRDRDLQARRSLLRCCEAGSSYSLIKAGNVELILKQLKGHRHTCRVSSRVKVHRIPMCAML